jgi:hypothetical protein
VDKEEGLATAGKIVLGSWLNHRVDLVRENFEQPGCVSLLVG